MNFVYSDPVAAFHRFLATRFVEHGSDQRADWIGNLLMLVPFGFLAAGAIWPRRPAFRLPAVIAAMLICSSVILAIKYLQLFFPPRTVTLNYIVAQGLEQHSAVPVSRPGSGMPENPPDGAIRSRRSCSPCGSIAPHC